MLRITCGSNGGYYIRLSPTYGSGATYTIEIVPGKVFADYDQEGKLWGVDMVTMCEVEIPLEIVYDTRTREEMSKGSADPYEDKKVVDGGDPL